MPATKTDPVAEEKAEALLEAAPVVLAPSAPDATIFERIVAIVTELPPIGKTEYNEQQKFHFRGHDAVLNALNPLLAKHGVFVIPTVLDRVADQRTTGGGKAMYEINLLIQFTFYGLAGDSVVGATWGEGTDMGDKATNKAMTMAFKAVIAQAFAVSTAEFADTDGATPEETTGRGSRSAPAAREKAVVEATAAEVAELVEHLLAEGISQDEIDATFEKRRAAERGKLSQEYVALNLGLSQARLERKIAAKKAADERAASRADGPPAESTG